MNAFFDWLHDTAERYALPAVCAFGLGVVVTLHAAEAEREHARFAVRALADQVEHARIACGAQPDPAALAARMAAAEVRP